MMKMFLVICLQSSPSAVVAYYMSITQATIVCNGKHTTVTEHCYKNKSHPTVLQSFKHFRISVV
jgi:hypothetical protein